MPPPPERRAHTRVKLKVPVEIYVEDSNAPLRGATADLSLHGCYIESIFPLPVATALQLKLQIGESTLLIVATVATSDPQVGNGIQFAKMLPEAIEELKNLA